MESYQVSQKDIFDTNDNMSNASNTSTPAKDYIEEKYLEMKSKNCFKADKAMQEDNAQKSYREQYIKFMEKEIDFLKSEIASKNIIIEILLEKRHIANQNAKNQQKTQFATNSQFSSPKRHYNETSPRQPSQFIQENQFSKLSADQIEQSENNSGKYELNDKNITRRNGKKKKHVTESNSDAKEHNNVDFNKKKTVCIVGDSIIKEIKGYEMSTRELKINIKSFHGATTTCMEHYIKPALAKYPDVTMIHCGTNDLRNGENPEEIASNIMNLADNASRQSTVVVSAIVHRDDSLNEKALKVNEFLENSCRSKGYGFIDHPNINANHLNRSRLHLNRKGTQLLKNNLFRAIPEN